MSPAEAQAISDGGAALIIIGIFIVMMITLSR